MKSAPTRHGATRCAAEAYFLSFRVGTTYDKRTTALVFTWKIWCAGYDPPGRGVAGAIAGSEPPQSAPTGFGATRCAAETYFLSFRVGMT